MNGAESAACLLCERRPVQHHNLPKHMAKPCDHQMVGKLCIHGNKEVVCMKATVVIVSFMVCC